MTFRIWLLVTSVVIVAGVAVPYGVLRGGATAFAVPLFWTGFGLAVVALITDAVAGWRR